MNPEKEGGGMLTKANRTIAFTCLRSKILFVSAYSERTNNTSMTYGWQQMFFN